jgi:hypothetical protein
MDVDALEFMVFMGVSRLVGTIRRWDSAWHGIEDRRFTLWWYV